MRGFAHNAAVVAGMAAQVGYKEAAQHSVEFTEEWGQVINLAVFFVFGLFSAESWSDFGWRHVAYAAISLTVVRMLPVALSLIGTRLSPATVMFMGWFGPRGLASIVLGLVYLEQTSHEPSEATIRLAVTVTVLSSIFVHGLTALPGMKLYAGLLHKIPQLSPEFEGANHATSES